MKEPDMQLAGGWVRSQRELRDLRGTDVAEEAGIHRSILSRLEGGSTPFTVTYVVQVADALGISREELVIRAVHDFAKREPCQGVGSGGTPHLGSGYSARAQPQQAPGHAAERVIYSPTRPRARPPQIGPRSP